MQRFETESSLFELPGFAEPSTSTGGSGAAPERQRRGQRRAAGAAADAHDGPPRGRNVDLVPWSEVEEVLAMSRDALSAKQHFAEVMRAEADKLKAESGAQKETWTRRAQRAEIDSGSLLEQLETLIQAKSALASDREELGRGISLLRAERELLCEQLQVDPLSANLCREVGATIVEARRAGVLEAQLRVLVRQRRQLRLELEATRDAHTRHWAEWQAREEAYRSALEAAGVPQPDLPPAPGAGGPPDTAGSPPRRTLNARDSCGGSISSCCDTGTGATCGDPSSSFASSGLAGPGSPGPVDASHCHPLFSPPGPPSPVPAPGRALCAHGAASCPSMRRSLSVDTGFDAALEQAGLEAALERLALSAAHGGDSAGLGPGGGAAGDEDDFAELAALVEDAAAEAACSSGSSSSSTSSSSVVAAAPLEDGRQQQPQQPGDSRGSEVAGGGEGGCGEEREGPRTAPTPTGAWPTVAALG